MGTITETIDVDVDVTTAYNQWTQFEEFPEFMMAVESVSQLTDDTLHWVTKAGPVVREYDAKITEQKPDEVVAWQSMSGTDNAGRVTFTRLGDHSTQIDFALTIDPEGAVEKVADASGALDVMVKGDLMRFKHFIEKRGQETGGWRGEIDGDDSNVGSGPDASGLGAGLNDAGATDGESDDDAVDSRAAGPDSPLGTGTVGTFGIAEGGMNAGSGRGL